jgi:hypothetical protein
MSENTENQLEIPLDDEKIASEGLEIALDGAETPERPETGPEIISQAENQASDSVVTPEQGIAELRAQMEAERSRRTEAESRVRQAYEQAQRARAEVDETNLTLLRSAIDNIKRDSDGLKAQYREALSVGDYDKAAEAQEAMATNAARLLQIEAGYAEMEHRARTPAPPPPPADPVEAFAGQLSSRSADWIRRNPDCVTNPRLQQKMIGAHTMAIADGLQPDSDAYFAAIEQALGMGAKAPPPPREADPVSAAGQAAPRRAAPPAAPVSRSGTPGRPANTVRLTAEEVDVAKTLGMTPVEYANHKRALIRDGRLKA